MNGPSHPISHHGDRRLESGLLLKLVKRMQLDEAWGLGWSLGGAGLRAVALEAGCCLVPVSWDFLWIAAMEPDDLLALVTERLGWDWGRFGLQIVEAVWGVVGCCTGT